MTTRPAIYQLFFARLDYLLSKRTAWVTCKQAEDLFIDGSLTPFCLVAKTIPLTLFRLPNAETSRRKVCQ